MWVKYNANPKAARVGDCTVRAISKATGLSWEQTYINIAIEGLLLRDMPSSNHVWGSYLYREGYRRKVIPNECMCYTVKDFAKDHPHGCYVLAISGHVVCCCDGDYFDTWDSGDEIPVFYWEKEKT